MRHLTLIVAAILLAPALFGQEIPERILEHIDDSRISLDYSCTVKAQPPFDNRGSLIIQGNCYRLRTSGFEIYCDARSRWTVDTASKEVVIEPSEGTAEFLGDTEGYLSMVENLKLSNVRYAEPDNDIGIFVYDCAGLGDDWVVTDLR